MFSKSTFLQNITTSDFEFEGYLDLFLANKYEIEYLCYIYPSVHVNYYTFSKALRYANNGERLCCGLPRMSSPSRSAERSPDEDRGEGY